MTVETQETQDQDGKVDWSKFAWSKAIVSAPYPFKKTVAQEDLVEQEPESESQQTRNRRKKVKNQLHKLLDEDWKAMLVKGFVGSGKTTVTFREVLERALDHPDQQWLWVDLAYDSQDEKLKYLRTSVPYEDEFLDKVRSSLKIVSLKGKKFCTKVGCACRKYRGSKLEPNKLDPEIWQGNGMGVYDFESIPDEYCRYKTARYLGARANIVLVGSDYFKHDTHEYDFTNFYGIVVDEAADFFKPKSFLAYKLTGNRVQPKKPEGVP